LVSREYLRKQVWGNQTHVDFEAGLNFCIRQIRRTLGDDARQPQLLETHPRRGYRFIGVVESIVLATPIADDILEPLRVKVTIHPFDDLKDGLILTRLAQEIAGLLLSHLYTDNCMPKVSIRKTSARKKGALVHSLSFHGKGDVLDMATNVRINGGSLDGRRQALLRLELSWNPTPNQFVASRDRVGSPAESAPILSTILLGVHKQWKWPGPLRSRRRQPATTDRPGNDRGGCCQGVSSAR
jgi:hypothetical protein